MHRQEGSAADIVSAIRHVLSETLGEDEALLITIPEPRACAAIADGANWKMEPSPIEPQHELLREVIAEVQRSWNLAGRTR